MLQGCADPFSLHHGNSQENDCGSLSILLRPTTIEYTMRTALSLISILLAVVGAHRDEPKASIATTFPDPNDDPFYLQTPDLADAKPGQVLRSRQVITSATGRQSKGYQLFYRTTNQQNNPIGTVATVWIPATPVHPPQIFSYEQAEDSLNLDCTPSWNWVNASSVLRKNYAQVDFITNWALEQGWYVVSADNEGPDSAWLVGHVEGQAALDAIRATINFAHLRSSEAQAALFGYSGGGHTAVWAGSLAATYAPELKIVGASFGGTPVDLASAYNLLNGALGAALAGGALFGLANGYPQLNETFNSILTPQGVAIASKLRSPNNCIPYVAIQYIFFNFNTIFTEPPLNNSVLAPILNQESLLTNVSTLTVPVPKFPRFQWHGLSDTTVPYAPEAAYVSQQCAAGADIRFVSLQNADHAPTFVRGLAGALQFIQQAFAGNVSAVPCGTNITIPVLGSDEAIQVLGVTNDAALIATLATL